MERLIEESYRRAVDGVEEPVVQGGKFLNGLEKTEQCASPTGAYFTTG